MSDRYLWDRSGEPDPEVERLERVLARLRHDSDPVDWSDVPTVAPRVARPRRRWLISWLPLPIPAAAALIAMVMAAGIGGIWLAQRDSGASWAVARLEGTPSVGATRIEHAGRLALGEWLETDAASRARIQVGKIGTVEVEPNTRVRLLGSRRQEHRLGLARGTLTAVILAPPRQFFVETPSAVAVDLGCAYTLEVDDEGAALVTVIVGWVSFEWNGRESFIPAGARCATRPGSGPGTPYFTDATAAFKNSLVSLDLGGLEAGARDAALDVVLAETRKEDAFTLWHLLARAQGPERARVYDRLATLVPPPPGVTRPGVLRGDSSMLDHWWNEFGFGDTEAWRKWKGDWPRTSKPG